jgi:hypothetical protein
MLNVKDAIVHEPTEGVTFMSELYEMQSKLVTLYCDQGKQSPPPIDLTKKDNQKFIRDLIGFLEEEIFEGYEHLEELTRTHPEIKPKQVMELIEKYNEEQSDAMHFFIEILMYVNIQVEDLRTYYETYFTQKDLKGMIDNDPLIMAFNHATTVDYMIGLRQRVSFRIAQTVDDLSTGGVLVGANSLTQSKEALFESFKYLRLATNHLKNKYWKDSETGINMELFFENIMEAWLHYVLYLHINGYTARSVRDTYIRKNLVNIDRIKNKY